MCGICGKYNIDGENFIQEALVRQMTRSLERRGPDDEGFFFYKHFGMGVRRLSIMDRERGGQPFFNEDKSVCVVYNGEIYNFENLRQDLVRRGHVFATECDGEVLAHLYEDHAELLFDKLHGMFAIALYDRTRGRLLIARDRIGIKPLYYCANSGGVLFSSTLRALLLDDTVSDRLDPAALQCYFAYNYFPEDITPFSQIRKLQAGCYLIADAGGVRIQRYWSVSARDHHSREAGFPGDQFHEVFKHAVRQHLVADVPVGVFLSGGVDSSYLAYTATEVAGRISTFTLAFREESFDEREYARLVSKTLNSRHYEVEISPDIASTIKKITGTLDVPLGEPSLIPTFELAAFTRQHCGVALSGEGADELFFGYETYKADRLAALLFSLPVRVRVGLLNGFAQLIPRTFSRLGLRFKLELIARGVSGSKEGRHYRWREVFSQSERQQLCQPDLFASGCAEESVTAPYEIFLRRLHSATSRDYIDQANLFDISVWLPDSVLHRVDMASMYHGLEVRVPYLDDDIVELVSRLPRQIFLNHFQGKSAIKAMLRNKLPHRILDRPKQGFSVPVSSWLRDDLVSFYNDTLSATSATAGKLLRYEYLRTLLQEHQSGKYDHGRRLWNALVFIVWYDSLKK